MTLILSEPVTLEKLEAGSLFFYKGTYALKTENYHLGITPKLKDVD